HLEPEVRRFEPKEAVVGGETGLEIILELLEQVRMWLAPGGWLVIEIAETQGERVSRLLGVLGYRDVAVTKDLAGRDRVVEARGRALAGCGQDGGAPDGGHRLGRGWERRGAAGSHAR